MRIILAICFALLFILPSCRDKKPDKLPPVKDERLPNTPIVKTKKLSFAIQYKKDLNFEFCKRDIVFLDMFDYSKKDVLKCKKLGATVYGYFSSQWEDWRIDSKSFPVKDRGEDLDDWPGEKWVNTKSGFVNSTPWLRERTRILSMRGSMTMPWAEGKTRT